MGVLKLRLPPIDTSKANKPTPIAPLSPHFSKPSFHLTTSLISPPLSALPRTYNFDAISPIVVPALSYLSTKLSQKNLHLTLIVGRGSSTPTTPSNPNPSLSLHIIPAATLSLKTWRTFTKCLEKTAQRFPTIGRRWFDALAKSQSDCNASNYNYLICQSIRQNQVLFSEEGLTLLNIDRVYTLKQRLQALSLGTGPLPWYTFVGSCISLLRQTVQKFDNRPLSKGFILRCYDHLSFNDDLLDLVAKVYEEEYGEPGIAEEDPELSELERQVSAKRPKGVNGWGPKTPLEKADITPTTGGEWERLLWQSCGSAVGAVGLLTTSPCEGVMV
jgi:hypothetical protein